MIQEAPIVKGCSDHSLVSGNCDSDIVMESDGDSDIDSDNLGCEKRMLELLTVFYLLRF